MFHFHFFLLGSLELQLHMFFVVQPGQLGFLVGADPGHQIYFVGIELHHNEILIQEGGSQIICLHDRHY